MVGSAVYIDGKRIGLLRGEASAHDADTLAEGYWNIERGTHLLSVTGTEGHVWSSRIEPGAYTAVSIRGDSLVIVTEKY